MEEETQTELAILKGLKKSDVKALSKNGLLPVGRRKQAGTIDKKWEPALLCRKMLAK